MKCYLGKVKRSRPSLRETRDKRPLGRESEGAGGPHEEYDKTFLITAHGSIGIGGRYGQGEKFSA